MDGEMVATTDVRQDLTLARDPNAVLAEAQKAAAALKDVISKKAKPVNFNGEQYLEFEDWQTVGKFYGVTVKVVDGSTRLVQVGEVVGYEARAVVIRLTDGMEVSAAEAMCLNDEPNWSKKPLFQLRSMAQTRACAKALRNVLAWVVVLAGYRPTPAEEMTDSSVVARSKPMQAPQRKSQAAPANGGDPRQMLWDECLSLANGNEAEARTVLQNLTTFQTQDGKTVAGKTDVSQLSEKWAAGALSKIRKQQAQPVAEADEIPFG